MMTKFAIEIAKCGMITIAVCGLAVCAVVLIPVEIYVRFNRSNNG